MKKINYLVAGSFVLLAATANSQNWSYSAGNTNAYLNPTNVSVSFGTSTVPLSGVKVDVIGGNLRVNSNQILLKDDNFHGIAYGGIFTGTGLFAGKTIDGPVTYGFAGGALGSNRSGTKNIALRWWDNGFVGIGTNAPEDFFQVGGDNALQKSSKIIMGSAFGAGLAYGTAYLGFNLSRQNLATWTATSDGGNNGGATIFSNVQGSLFFSSIPATVTGGNTNQTGITDATVLANTRLFIRGNDGKVGINTSNPVARLEVNTVGAEDALNVRASGGPVNFLVKSTGYVYARDITVQTGTFPDYVFAKDYKLMPLSEVKRFIDNNSHLPEMPTAEEVEKDGMSVSKINTLLVQKVEELTLYVIKLQEEVDQLKSQK